MTLDLTPVLDTLAGLAFAAVSAAIPILVPAILRRLKIANNSDLAQRIETAADAGAGLAYQYAVTRAGGLNSVAVKDSAINRGVSHVLLSLPDTLKSLDVTDEHVKDMVTARLGALLATDPTVTATPVVPIGVTLPPGAMSSASVTVSSFGGAGGGAPSSSVQSVNAPKPGETVVIPINPPERTTP